MSRYCVPPCRLLRHSLTQKAEEIVVAQATAKQNGTITLSELLGDERQCDVKWLQHEFWVKYRPSATTPEFYARTRSRAIDGDVWGAEAIKLAVSAMLTDWSLVDENHIRVPITEETLNGLPNQLLWNIWNACQDDLRPKDESESPSKAP